MKKKNIIIGAICIICTIIIVGLLFYFEGSKKTEEKPKTFSAKETNYLSNIKVLGYNLDKTFDKKTMEYNVEVDEDKVYIFCTTDYTIKGCGENPYIPEEGYTHKIKIDDFTEYKINFTKKIENANFRIKSIDGIPFEANGKEATITIDAIGEGLTYTFDGGTTWQEINQIVAKENETLKIAIKDVNGNQSSVKEIPVNIIEEELSSFGPKHTEQNKSGNGYADGGDYTNNDDYVKFYSNGGTLKGTTYVKCQQSIKGKCSGTCCVTAPDYVLPDGYKFNGWSKNSNDKYGSNWKTIDVKKQRKYYLTMSKDINITYKKNGADKIGNSTAEEKKTKCSIYNKETSCEVTLPSIEAKNKDILGWARKDSTDYKKPGNTFKISQNTTLYANTKNKTNSSSSSSGPKITSSTSSNGEFVIGKVTFKKEKMDSSKYSTYQSRMENVAKTVPQLFYYPTTVTLMSKSNFEAKYGKSKYATITGSSKNKEVIVKNSLTDTEYMVQLTIHELAHALDEYFVSHIGWSKIISQQGTITVQYDILKGRTNKPLRNNSYKNYKEFWADAVMYYYYEKCTACLSSEKTAFNNRHKGFIDGDTLKIVDTWLTTVSNKYKG